MNRPIKATDYDIAGIIAYAISRSIDIATQEDEKEWKMLAYAFRALGIDEASFVAVSRIHGDATERESRAAYRYAKRKYHDPEAAAQKILYFASRAGIKIYDFLPEDKQAEVKAYLRENESSAPRRRLEQLRSFIYETTTAAPVVKQQSEPTPATEFLSSEIISQMESLTEQTTLYKFVLSEFGSDVRNVFAAYHVGGCKWQKQAHGYATAFPLIDIAGRLRDFQLSAFDPNGHGSKYPSGDKIKGWAMAELNEARCKECKPHENRQQHKDCPNRNKCPKMRHRVGMCFFGEHLLAERPADPVAIVEAPKTALIGALVYPEFVWLSCLSLDWLPTAVSPEPLRGREVWLFPDRDGIGKWNEKAADLNAQGYDMGVSDFIENHPHPQDPDGKSKDLGGREDLADIVLRLRHGEAAPPQKPEQNLSPDKAEAYAAFEEMKKHNPVLAELAELFELEPIRVEPNRGNDVINE